MSIFSSEEQARAKDMLSQSESRLRNGANLHREYVMGSFRKHFDIGGETLVRFGEDSRGDWVEFSYDEKTILRAYHTAVGNPFEPIGYMGAWTIVRGSREARVEHHSGLDPRGDLEFHREDLVIACDFVLGKISAERANLAERVFAEKVGILR